MTIALRSRRSLTVLAGLVLSIAGALAAFSAFGASAQSLPPGVSSATYCVNQNSFHFDVQLTGIPSPDANVFFRISSDALAFGGADTERIEVNYDTPGGAIDHGPEVNSFGAAPDRWQNGPISDFSLTDLGGGSWRVLGSVANGASAFSPGDQVFETVVRTSQFSDSGIRLTPITSCPSTPTPTPTATPTATPTPTPTATPTATPTPTPTPTPAATALPLFEFVPLPNLLPVVFPAFPKPDLSIHGIEITQAIQCFDTSNGLAGCPDNSMPVVAKKDTTARVYPRYSGPFTQMAGVPVRLHIFANGVEYIVNSFGTAKTFIDQANNDNANFWFNVNFTNSIDVSFYAEVDPNNVVAETNESNNRFPASGMITKNFQKRDTVDITSWRTRYHPSGYTGTQYAEGWAVNGGAADWLEALWPVRSGNGIDHTLKSGYLNWTTSVSSSNGQHALIQRLNSEWVMHNILPFIFGTNALTGAEHVYGWVDAQGYGGGHADMPVYPHAGGLGVVGIGTDNYAGSPSVDSPSSGATIFGHELTHDYNVYHTNTGGDDCGSDDGNSDFPYNTSSIQEFGYNPDTGMIYDPATTHDVMSYCPPGSKQAWIAPFTWNKMFGKFNPSIAGTSVAGPNTFYGQVLPTGAEASLAGSVFVDNPDIEGDDGAALQNLHKVDGVGLQVNPPPGEYQVQLRDGETVLGAKAFTVDFTSEYASHVGPEAVTQAAQEEVFSPQPAPFAQVPFIMPWVDGATSVALVFGGEILDEVSVSANAPVVSFTSPAGPESWDAGATETLTWEGSDVDGGPLTYSILYTVGDDIWELIASGITGTSYDVEVDFFAGSDSAQFGVVATDGINIGSDESPLISIPNKPPMVSISDPAPGTVVTPGGLVVLSGAAVDLEDGSLADDVYEWSSDRDGALGTGPSLPVNTLSNGPHTITLTVEDSGGASATATVDVVVAIPAVVDVQPDVISPGGTPPGVTVIVVLPFGYPTNTLDLGTLQMIIGTATLDPTDAEVIGDTDSDGLIELKLTFDGAAVQSALPGGIGLARARIIGETDGGIGVSGSDTISQVSAGDANCDGSINPVDSLTVLRYDAGLPVSSTEDCILATADVNCDGEVNPVDSLGILRFDAGLSVNQPGDCPPLGTPPIVAAIGSGTGGNALPQGFPALPPIAWLGLAVVFPALVLSARKRL